MKYYYADNNEKYGPFTIEQLQEQRITGKSLVWFEGETEWKPISTHPELSVILQPFFYTETKPVVPPAAMKTPPPLPLQVEEIASHTVTGETDISLTTTPRENRPPVFLYIWSACHLFALLMSYTRMPIFNNTDAPKTSEFWPFVNFNDGGMYVKREFSGLFSNYDWTEFALYVGFAWIVYILLRLSKRST